jgi:hypothetical protein
VADLDHDARDDVLIGAPGYATGGTGEAGAFYAFIE